MIVTRLRPLDEEKNAGPITPLPPALSASLGSGMKHWYLDEMVEHPLLCVSNSIDAHKRITGTLPTHLECSPSFLQAYCASIGLDWQPVYYVCGKTVHLIPVAGQQECVLLSYGETKGDWML